MSTFQWPADRSWLAFNGVQGGWVLAGLLAGAAEAVPAPVVTISAHFFAPAAPGWLDVSTKVLHGGRTASVAAEIEGTATALVRVARDDAPAELAWPPPSPPVAAPETLERLELPLDFVPMSQHLDIRPINTSRPLAGGTEPAFDAWIRLLPSAFALRALKPAEVAAVLLDALPPALFATMTRPIPIPTAELTAHFAPTAFAPDAWLRVRQRASWATATLCVDETVLSTADGNLAAQARQFRRILPA